MSGYQLTKTHGQHILTNLQIINNIVAAAEIRPSDTVLEIGPGSGNLTVQLLAHAQRVVAVEIDARMVSELRKRIPEQLRPKLAIVHGDFTKVDIPPFDLCVSNCPYNISAPIVFRLLSLAQQLGRPRAFTLMFQLEFAQSLVAEPRQAAYSRLSANVRLLTKSVRMLFKVDRKNFTPPPQVESAVVQMVPVVDIGLEARQLQQFEAITRVCFSTKNKMLRAILGLRGVQRVLSENYKLVSGQPIDSAGLRTLVAAALDEVGLAETRPAAMHANDFLRLLRALGERGLYLG